MQDPAAIDRLKALIVALDGRPQHPNRPQEAAIAKDASEMRGKAVVRLAQLQPDPLSSDS
jgi:hypothetical protein